MAIDPLLLQRQAWQQRCTTAVKSINSISFPFRCLYFFFVILFCAKMNVNVAVILFCAQMNVNVIIMNF